MKQFVIREDLRNDVLTYINNSNSKFDFNLVKALVTLLEQLSELPASEELQVVTPEVVEETTPSGEAQQ